MLQVATIGTYAHSGHRELQEAVVGLIRTLSLCAAVRRNPTAQATIEGVVESLKAHAASQTLVESACGALCNMVIDQVIDCDKLPAAEESLKGLPCPVPIGSWNAVSPSWAFQERGGQGHEVKGCGGGREVIEKR